MNFRFPRHRSTSPHTVRRGSFAKRFVLLLVISIISSYHVSAAAQDFAVGELPLDELPAARAYDVDFDDWDIGTLLRRVRRVGIRLPIDVQGKVSGWLWVQRSTGGWFDFRGYLVEGELSSPRLTVEGWTFENARVRFGYANNEWQISHLFGGVGHTDQETQIGIVDLSFQLPMQPAESGSPPAESDEGASLQATLDARATEVNLAALFQALQLPLVVSNQPGTLNLQGSVGVDDLRTVSAWSFHSSFLSERLNLEKNPIRNVQVQAELSQGAAAVEARGYAGEGEINSQLRWSDLFSAPERPQVLSPYWPRMVGLQLDQLRLESLALGLGVPLAGVVTGEWQLNLGEAENQFTWSTQGNLTVEELVIDAIRAGNLTIAGEKEVGQQQFQGAIRLNRGEGNLQADLTLQIGAAGPELSGVRITNYQLHGSLDRFPVSSEEFRDLLEVPNLYTLQASGTFSSEGSSDDWLEFAQVQLQSSTLSIDAREVFLEQVFAQATKEEFRLPRLKITLDDQRIVGSALVRRDNEGSHQANLLIDDLNLGPWVEMYAPPAVQSLEGSADLQLHVQKLASETNWLQGWNGTIQGDVAELRWQGMSVGSLAFRGDLTPKAIAAQADGSLLGGECHLAARIVPPGNADDQQAQEAQQPQPMQAGFDVTLNELSLRALLAALRGPRWARAFTGNMSLEGHFETADGQLTAAEIDLSIPQFDYLRRPIFSQFTLRANLDEDSLDIARMRGRVAGGRVMLRGGGAREEVNNYSVDIQELEIGRLAALVGLTLTDQLSGRLTFRGNLRYDPTRAIVSALGSAALSDALVYDLPIQQVLGMVSANYQINQNHLSISSRDLHGQVMGGDLRGEAQLQGSSRLRLATSAELTGGEMEVLSRALGFETVVGQGRFDAATRLTSADVVALNQLQGSARFDFESGSPKSAPLLGDVAKFVPFQQFQSTDIDAGLLRAQIGGGQARVQDFQIFSEAFLFAGTGSVGLTGGRLDIQAILETGGGWQQRLGSQGILLLAPNLVPQIALITQAADLINNRTVYLRVGGTTSRPVIQSQLVRSLGRAYAQNLLRSITGVAVSTTASTN